MKMFIAYNGWTGNGAVHCYVIAKDEECALKAVKPHFYDAGYKELKHLKDEAAKVEHAKKYSKNIEIEEVCADTAVPWVGAVLD